MANESNRWSRWLLAASLPILAIAAVVTARSYPGHQAPPFDVARARVALTPSPRAIGMSPDGTQLLFQSESADGFDLTIRERGSMRAIATVATGKRARQAVWSPDGKRVAYGLEHGRAECELRIWDIPSGKSLTPVVPSTRIVTSPRWARSGDRVTYIVEHADARRLFSVEPIEGGSAVELAPDLTPKAGLAWAPDGSARIATVLRSDPSAVTIVDVQGGRTRMPMGEGAEIHDVGWPKDESLLVTVRGRGEASFALAEVDIAHGSARRLAPPPIDGDVTSPALLPNGEGLHYRVRHGDEQLLFVCALAGTSCRRLGPSSLAVWRVSAAPLTIFGRERASVIALDVASGESSVVYEPPKTGIAGERVDVPSFDGLAIPLLVRRAESSATPAAVIHVLAGDHESPSPWDTRTDYLHDAGIAVVNVYVRGKPGFGRALHDAQGDPARDVLAAREWVTRVLHVGPERTVLLGQSAGASVAAAAAALSPPFAGVVLVSVPKDSAAASERATATSPRCAFVFHGSDDESTPADARAAVERVLGRGATGAPCGGFQVLPGEAHEIEQTASWVEIYRAILAALVSPSPQRQR